MTGVKVPDYGLKGPYVVIGADSMGHRGSRAPHFHEWLGPGGTVSNKSVGHIGLFSCMA